MPAKRLSMRKIKEVLRLRWGHGLSKRKTALSCGLSRPAVDEYLTSVLDNYMGLSRRINCWLVRLSEGLSG